jgi:hypothetical protein
MFFSLRLVSYLILFYRLTNRHWNTILFSMLLSHYILTKCVTQGEKCIKHPWPGFLLLELQVIVSPPQKHFCFWNCLVTRCTYITINFT